MHACRVVRGTCSHVFAIQVFLGHERGSKSVVREFGNNNPGGTRVYGRTAEQIAAETQSCAALSLSFCLHAVTTLYPLLT